MIAAPARRINPDEWKSWDPKSKEKLISALEAAERPKRVWYCTKGRTCNGKPHEGFDYPHARGDQWPPTGRDWLVWLLKGGRGSGKTRSGAEWIRKMSETLERVSIIGPSWQHVRDTMIEGDSGLLAVFESAKAPVVWEPSKKKLTVPCKCALPANSRLKVKHRKGHFIQAFTGEEPERLRGPQHAAVWLDEPAHFALIEATWDNMMFGLRLGKRPVVLCSTTPLPTKWMKKLIKEPDTVSVTVSTYKNMDNLAPTFRKVMLAKYEGTRLGRQELHGEVLEDIVGALWTWSLIEDHRILPTLDESGEVLEPAAVTYTDMDRIVVAIDPAGSSDRKRDETGIVVVGRRGEEYYVLADLSGHYTPEGWSKAAWEAFDLFEADKIVAEKNYGGEMVLSTLRNARKDGPVELVTSRRGKVLRAEPVVSLYEQGRVHHLDLFEELETQMTEWVPAKDDSPDRVDALVHGITLLGGIAEPAAVAIPKGSITGRSMGSVSYGGLTHAAASDLLGRRSPEAEEVTIAAVVTERVLRVVTADSRFDPADCSHDAMFESRQHPGLHVCRDCLAEMEILDAESAMAHQ